MRNIQLTVIFTAQVPDDTDIDALCLNLDLSQVQVVDCRNPELKASATGPVSNSVNAKLQEYETVGVEEGEIA